MISDASKLVDVESHVLRYWEEELDMEIPRNEMGHRYYTRKHIDVLRHVKELKDNGFQLKAIKMLVPEMMKDEQVNIEELMDQAIHQCMLMEQAEAMKHIHTSTMEQVDKQVQENVMTPNATNQTTLGEKAINPNDAVHLENELQATDGANQTPAISQANLSKQTNLSQHLGNNSLTKMEQFQLILGDIVAQALKDNNVSLGKEVSERVSDSVIKEMDYLLRMNQEREEARFKKLDETIRSYQKERKEVAVTKEKRGLFFRRT